MNNVILEAILSGRRVTVVCPSEEAAKAYYDECVKLVNDMGLGGASSTGAYSIVYSAGKHGPYEEVDK